MNTSPTISEIIFDIIKTEGGFTSNKNDNAHYGDKKNRPGVLYDCYCTNLGITQLTYSMWLGRQASIDEIRTMSTDDAYHIYETEYYTKPRFDRIHPTICAQMVDIGVNSGPKTAIKILQKVINAAGFGPVDVDGILGPDTINRTNRAAEEMGGFLCNAIVDERKNFYRILINNNSKNKVFENGWMSRAERFREVIE